MEMGGRGTFSHESNEFSRMEGGQEFLSTDFTDFHRWGWGGRRTEDGRRRTEDRGMGERIDSFKEWRVDKEAWALNLEVLLLGTICVNPCNLWITHPRFPAFV